MHIKSSQLEDNYDYIIIGAGIVGLTILRELIEKGKRNILILESGSMLSKNPYPDFMKVESSKFNIKKKSRFSGVGGGSNVWGSICGVFDQETIDSYFKRKKFPFDYNDYKYYLKKAVKYGYPDISDFSTDVKINEKLKVKKIIKIHPNIKYFHFSSILECQSVHFMQNVIVEKIDNSKVFINSHEPRHKIYCSQGKKIILCANTFENVKILNNSNLKLNNNFLGKGYMNHPKGIIGSFKNNNKLDKYLPSFKTSATSYLGIQQVNSNFKHYLKISKGFKIPKIDNLLRFLEGNFVFKNDEVFGQFNKIFNKLSSSSYFLLKLIDKFLNKSFHNYLNVQVFAETKNNTSNYISYSKHSQRTIINYELGAEELNDLKKLIYSFEKEFDVNILFKPNSLKKLKECISNDSSHHMGGIVCGADNTNSIVDLNLCVHNSNNIYVCGGAIFPFSGVVNPTLSYVAIAIWLTNKVL